MATYTVIAQNMTSGSIVETKTYDNLAYAQIHYDALSTWDSNRLIKKDNNTITVVEDSAKEAEFYETIFKEISAKETA